MWSIGPLSYVIAGGGSAFQLFLHHGTARDTELCATSLVVSVTCSVCPLRTTADITGQFVKTVLVQLQNVSDSQTIIFTTINSF